jgi:hypothetical protein
MSMRYSVKARAQERRTEYNAKSADISSQQNRVELIARADLAGRDFAPSLTLQSRSGRGLEGLPHYEPDYAPCTASPRSYRKPRCGRYAAEDEASQAGPSWMAVMSPPRCGLAGTPGRIEAPVPGRMIRGQWSAFSPAIPAGRSGGQYPAQRARIP